MTAPVVQRIFREFLGLGGSVERGLFAIAEGLTRDGIPSPSAHDRARNRHREGAAWAKGAVRAILTNPRYTGIVVGEYERAFCGEQFTAMAPLFQRLGVQVWLPKAGGPGEAGSVEHRVLMAVLGAHSQREVLRSRHGVLTAMRSQACDQGRFVGGRPPCGCRLVDAATTATCWQD